jgi:hypothetical protein
MGVRAPQPGAAVGEGGVVEVNGEVVGVGYALNYRSRLEGC